MILQQAVALSHGSLSPPHIIISAPLLLADLGQMIVFCLKSYLLSSIVTL